MLFTLLFRYMQIKSIRLIHFSHYLLFAATGITESEKYEILEAHNRLRSQVAQGQVPGQPSAQNMREMHWDEELAQRAQQWANQCYFEHDPSRYTSMYFYLFFLYSILSVNFYPKNFFKER